MIPIANTPVFFPNNPKIIAIIAIPKKNQPSPPSIKVCDEVTPSTLAVAKGKNTPNIIKTLLATASQLVFLFVIGLHPKL